MLATPHMAAGAAIGKLLRKPSLAYPAAFASHFLLDRVPHLDSHRLFGRATAGVTTGEVTMAAIDTVAGIALVFWASREQPLRRVILGAALFGILIDLIDNVPPWGDWFSAWPGTAWLSTFHHAFQHNVARDQWLLGFGTQIAVVAVSLWVLRAWTGGRAAAKSHD